VSQPTVGAAAQELYDGLASIYGADDEANGWALLRLCEAFAAGLEQLQGLLGDDSLLPWAILFDADQCPDEYLPWLAWVLGIVVRGETGDTLRALVRDRPPAKRGTPDAMRAAAASALTGTQTVRYLERANGPFEDTIVTLAAETPDPAAVVRAAEPQRRAFSVLTHVVTDDVLWADATLTWDQVDDTVTWDTVALGDV
jgi:hypothetical protein